METINRGTIRWLLDSDPAIRWQVMRDLQDEPAEAWEAERARVATEGWGAALLAHQHEDGNWGPVGHDWRWSFTLYVLHLLCNLGLDPASEPARRAVGLVRGKVDWGPWQNHSPFFEGEVEPCINGMTLAIGGYFGAAGDGLAERLLSEQLEDGGWNCEAERGSVRSSFHTTICVLEGLLQYERMRGPTAAVTAARLRGHEYLLERRLFRRLSTGQVISHEWTRFKFPSRCWYDVLRGLDYLRDAGAEPDPRAGDAIALVGKRRHQNGRWALGKPHDDDPTRAFLQMDAGWGLASRWNTLRAARVLRWYHGA